MNTQPKVLKWSLIFGIVIVLNMFFNYTLSLVYKQPTYENFCSNDTQVLEPLNTKESCLAVGGQWNGNVYNGSPTPVPTIKGQTEPAGYCNPQFTCQNNYNAAQKVYDRNVFITLVILGALCVALANFWKGNMVLSAALSLGGVLSFIIASFRIWGTADDLIKVIILAIALGILASVAIKKFRDV